MSKYDKHFMWADLIFGVGGAFVWLVIMLKYPQTIPVAICAYIITRTTMKFFEERNKLKGDER